MEQTKSTLRQSYNETEKKRKLQQEKDEDLASRSNREDQLLQYAARVQSLEEQMKVCQRNMNGLAQETSHMKLIIKNLVSSKAALEKKLDQLQVQYDSLQETLASKDEEIALLSLRNSSNIS
jgi:hypothetical protein